jgi:hypothetical protein
MFIGCGYRCGREVQGCGAGFEAADPSRSGTPKDFEFERSKRRAFLFYLKYVISV